MTEEESRPEDHEGVEDLVVPEDVRNRIRALRRIDDRTERVEEAARDERSDGQRARGGHAIDDLPGTHPSDRDAE